ncbi:hypothetical protein [Vibrio sp. WXL210]|uniref:hypothetical protein n=1 Tax=Vibrio sp. WXL210 TaxID=3450709 RepID=UPI003EC6B3E1
MKNNFSYKAILIAFLSFNAVSQDVVEFTNGTRQSIKSHVEPDFIDYSYSFHDLNFNGQLDLIINERASTPDTQFAHLFNSDNGRFDDQVAFDVDSIFKSSDFVCTIKSDQGKVIVKFRYKDSTVNQYYFDYKAEQLDGEKIENSFEKFEKKLKECTDTENVY